MSESVSSPGENHNYSAGCHLGCASVAQDYFGAFPEVICGMWP